ncbi:unnamed protein product [Fraxinus pennsylvanica]|uniref:RRM domain-containing protein n=1 Tax=Fraxinus pennsylvanica TaxID=56036 RepID=A0AAD1YL30_9LAMI|nr:unnamed protein product [Fraxinus pennsylvanica]
MANQPPQATPGSGSGPGLGGFQYMNSPFGDTTFTKVFVGGLAWETQSETMRRYFEQFGEILEAVVITDKNTGRSKGYGFVTFRHPESARRACADPSPIIDGRRANCNLASLGRPRPALHFGRLRSPAPYLGGLPAARGPYVGSFGYQQTPTYGYQQGLMYSPYGYAAYSPEYAYLQGVYNPYAGQQYLPIYGVPGAGYAMSGHPIVQFGGPSVTAMATTSVPAPFPTGAAAPITPQPQFILSSHSPQFMQGSSSDQNAGLANYPFCILEVLHFRAHRRTQCPSCS